MTSVNGYHLVSAPCCLHMYSVLAYSSINTRNWQRWSDGYAFGDLYKPPSRICRCECGEYFLADDAQTLDYVRFKDAPNDRPKSLPRLSWLDAWGIMEKGGAFSSEAIECEVRLLYWHCLNHRYRTRNEVDDHRQHLSDLGDVAPRPLPFSQLPDSVIDRRISENLDTLYPMLIRRKPDAYLLLGEACRAAGRMSEAVEHFKQVSGNDYDAAAHLMELALANSSCVIRIDPADWKDLPKKQEPQISRLGKTEAVEIRSRDYWFKIFGMLNQLWVLIDKPAEDAEVVFAYWIDDNSKITDIEVFDDEGTARLHLIEDGYRRYDETPDVSSFLIPPGEPFGFEWITHKVQ